MKFLHLLRLFAIIFFWEGNAFAQISPGELSKAHANLEGVSNCTKCHSVGNKVTDEKCLDCHKEIKLLITSKEGFHASDEVKGKECYTCPVSYTHLRAHETDSYLVCRLL